MFGPTFRNHLIKTNMYVGIWITLYVYYKSMRNKNQYYRLRHHHPPSAELAFTLANKNFKKCIRFTNYLPTITATKQIVGNMQCGWDGSDVDRDTLYIL